MSMRVDPSNRYNNVPITTCFEQVYRALYTPKRRWRAFLKRYMASWTSAHQSYVRDPVLNMGLQKPYEPLTTAAHAPTVCYWCNGLNTTPTTADSPVTAHLYNTVRRARNTLQTRHNFPDNHALNHYMETLHQKMLAAQAANVPENNPEYLTHIFRATEHAEFGIHFGNVITEYLRVTMSADILDYNICQMLEPLVTIFTPILKCYYPLLYLHILRCLVRSQLVEAQVSIAHRPVEFDPLPPAQEHVLSDIYADISKRLCVDPVFNKACTLYLESLFGDTPTTPRLRVPGSLQAVWSQGSYVYTTKKDVVVTGPAVRACIEQACSAAGPSRFGRLFNTDSNAGFERCIAGDLSQELYKYTQRQTALDAVALYHNFGVMPQDPDRFGTDDCPVLVRWGTWAHVRRYYPTRTLNRWLRLYGATESHVLNPKYSAQSRPSILEAAYSLADRTNYTPEPDSNVFRNRDTMPAPAAPAAPAKALEPIAKPKAVRTALGCMVKPPGFEGDTWKLVEPYALSADVEIGTDFSAYRLDGGRLNTADTERYVKFMSDIWDRDTASCKLEASQTPTTHTPTFTATVGKPKTKRCNVYKYVLRKTIHLCEPERVIKAVRKFISTGVAPTYLKIGPKIPAALVRSVLHEDEYTINYAMEETVMYTYPPPPPPPPPERKPGRPSRNKKAAVRKPPVLYLFLCTAQRLSAYVGVYTQHNAKPLVGIWTSMDHFKWTAACEVAMVIPTTIEIPTRWCARNGLGTGNGPMPALPLGDFQKMLSTPDVFIIPSELRRCLVQLCRALEKNSPQWLCRAIGGGLYKDNIHNLTVKDRDFTVEVCDLISTYHRPYNTREETQTIYKILRSWHLTPKVELRACKYREELLARNVSNPNPASGVPQYLQYPYGYLSPAIYYQFQQAGLQLPGYRAAFRQSVLRPAGFKSVLQAIEEGEYVLPRVGSKTPE